MAIPCAVRNRSWEIAFRITESGEMCPCLDVQELEPVAGSLGLSALVAASNYVSAQLADIGASLAGAAALVAVAHTRVPAADSVRAAILTGVRGEDLDEEDPRPEVVRAYAPYALIVALSAPPSYSGCTRAWRSKNGRRRCTS